jgi:hypothetical protein
MVAGDPPKRSPRSLDDHELAQRHAQGTKGMLRTDIAGSLHRRYARRDHPEEDALRSPLELPQALQGVVGRDPRQATGLLCPVKRFVRGRTDAFEEHAEDLAMRRRAGGRTARRGQTRHLERGSQRPDGLGDGGSAGVLRANARERLFARHRENLTSVLRKEAEQRKGGLGSLRDGVELAEDGAKRVVDHPEPDERVELARDGAASEKLPNAARKTGHVPPTTRPGHGFLQSEPPSSSRER